MRRRNIGEHWKRQGINLFYSLSEKHLISAMGHFSVVGVWESTYIRNTSLGESRQPWDIF